MLLFKPYHVPLILDGTKTQTRRIWKKNRAKVGSIHKAKTVMLSTDFFAYIKITGIRKGKLGDITEEDAQAEGGYTIEEYKKVWGDINGGWDDNLIVTVIDFKNINTEV